MNKLAQVVREPEDWSCPFLDARMGELSLIKGELALEAPEELALTFEAPERTAHLLPPHVVCHNGRAGSNGVGTGPDPHLRGVLQVEAQTEQLSYHPGPYSGL